MGGKPLRNLLCCYHPKATEDMKDELRSLSAYHNQSCHIGQINSDQTIDLLETDQQIALMSEKCTYKRNESPNPMEVVNLKINGSAVSFF
ncbi:hypothetical protein ACH3XW_15050 [Acanthocheilonema viteae]